MDSLDMQKAAEVDAAGQLEDHSWVINDLFSNLNLDPEVCRG
jgi:hypothetical protein